MLNGLLNVLLGSQLAQQPLTLPNVSVNNAVHRQSNTRFELQSGPDVFTPKDLLGLPRPGIGVVNPDKADLVIVPVSQYDFATKKTNRTIYISPLESTVTPVEFPLISGGEAFWLDSRTIAHVVGENIYAVSLEYETTPPVPSPDGAPQPLVRVPHSPYLVGSFPPGSGATNFKFTKTKKAHTTEDDEDENVEHLLVFSAMVYDDYNLTSVKEQDEARAKRDTSAMVYDTLFVRHWDVFVGEKKPRLFTVELKWAADAGQDEGKWTLGQEFYKPLEFTEHYTPVEPFGGTDDFDVSREHIVYTTKDPSVSEALHTRQNVYLVPLKGGLEPQPLTTGNQGATHSPVFSPDGCLVAWTEMAQDGYESDKAVVVLFDLKTRARWVVTEKWDRSVSEVAFSEDGKTLFVTAAEHAHVKVFSIDLPSLSATSKKSKKPKFPTPVAITHEHSAHGLQPIAGHKLLFTQSSFTSPNNVFVADLCQPDKIAIEQITKFGATELEGKKLDAGESFWFEGAQKGRKVQGWAFKPYGYEEGLAKGKKWRTVLLIHGGPQGAWEDGWSTRWNPNIFAQQGYFVIAINPTGSTGFGQDFTDAIAREWGGKPFIDLKRGWEYALKHYPIDKDRAVGAGASYGGYAINWIQGHPEYGFGFKALFCHDGLFDARNGGYATDELYFWDHEFGGKPWSKKARRLADRFNPSEFVHKWSTPQLIVHGGRDYRLGEMEGLAAFNALQRLSRSSPDALACADWTIAGAVFRAD
ncbi:hypothetical protein FRB99_006629 [Tulasnella sp. 403]|nr:hypothetical protein FRB99_006629 [Tulasnella sp. 403]